jgi:nitrite reductase (NO-forming)
VEVENHAQMAHSLDTHAAKTPPNKNYPIVLPGQKYEWEFVPKYPGAYMYHCGTPPVLMHIGAGMYGAWIVDPKGGWPPAQELVFVQSEFYLSGSGDVRTPDFAKMMQYGVLDYVVFNGYANQYVEQPIAVKVGEPVRLFVVNAGPNIWSSFHVVGTIFDAVYLNANPQNKAIGLQSVSIGPGDGACVEFTLEEPGTYTAVNHAFGHAQHGAIALLQAS